MSAQSVSALVQDLRALSQAAASRGQSMTAAKSRAGSAAPDGSGKDKLYFGPEGDRLTPSPLLPAIRGAFQSICDVAEKIRTVPWAKPLIKAQIALVGTLRHIQLQHDNAQSLLRLVLMTGDLALAAALDNSNPDPASLRQKQQIFSDLESAFREANLFLLEFTPFVAKPWLLHLAKAEDDLAYFRDFGARISDRLRALAAAASPADAEPPAGLAEFEKGGAFPAAEDTRQSQLRGRVQELADRATIVEALQRVMTNENLCRQLALELNANGPLFRTKSQDASLTIFHPEMRTVWTKVAGSNEKADGKDILKGIRDYLVNYDFGSGLKIYEPTGNRLDDMSRARLRALIDYDGDGIISIRDVNSVFLPVTASLESIVLRLLDSPPVPSNLPPLPESYVARPELENAVRDNLFSRQTSGVTVMGPAGSGRATLANAVVQRLTREYRNADKTLQGAFLVEARGIYRVPDLLDVIANTLRISGTSLVTLRDILARLQLRLKAGPIILILNNMEGLVDPITGDDAVIPILRAFAETPGLQLVIVSTKDPGLPQQFPIVAVPLLAHPGIARKMRVSDHSEVPMKELAVRVASATVTNDERLLNSNKNITGVIDSLPKGLRKQVVKLSVFPSVFTPEAAESLADLKYWELTYLVRRGLVDERNGRFIVHTKVREAIETVDRIERINLEGIRERMLAWAVKEFKVLGEMFSAKATVTALCNFDYERPLYNAVLEHFKSGSTSSPIYNSIIATLSEISDLLECRFYSSKLIELLDTSASSFAGRNPEVQAQLEESVGLIIQRSGDYAGAIERFARSLELRVAALGPEHADVAVAYQNIGTCLFSLAKYPEALEQHSKCLAIRLKSFQTENNAAVAASYNIIGNCYFAMGRYEPALENYRKCLDIRINLYGPEDIAVAASYSALGNFLQSQGRYDEAKEQFEHALEIRTRTYTGDHPDVAASLSSVGSCYYSKGKFNEAYDRLQKALQMQLRILGPDHPSVATSYSGVGSCLYAQGRYDEALYLHRRCLDIQLKTFGEEHPSVATSMAAIASCLQVQGNYPEALEKFRRCLEIQVATLTADHPSIATTCCNLGDCLMAHGKYDQAMGYYERSLQIRMRKFGEEHPDVAASYGSIGTCWQFQNKPQKALENLHKCLDIQMKTLKPDHPDIATTHSAIGTCLQMKGKPEEAVEEHQMAVDIRTKSYGPEHRLTKVALDDLRNTKLQSKVKKEEKCCCTIQ